MGFEPEPARDGDRLDAASRPPIDFLAGAVQFAMMRAAQRDREFVADLEAESAGLRKPQMVGVGGLPAADEAGLFGHEPQMLLVPQPFALGQGQDAFVDAGVAFVARRRRVRFGWREVSSGIAGGGRAGPETPP